MAENITKVGIGVVVLDEKDEGTRILLGKRKGSHGENEWALPGGHLEYMESFKATAQRELAEELGDQFKVYDDFEVVSVINLTEYAPKHYIDIGMCCWWESGDPVVMEPDKCEEWKWFDIDDLPSPRFATVDRIISSINNFSLDHVQVFDKGETI